MWKKILYSTDLSQSLLTLIEDGELCHFEFPDLKDTQKIYKLNVKVPKGKLKGLQEVVVTGKENRLVGTAPDYSVVVSLEEEKD